MGLGYEVVDASGLSIVFVGMVLVLITPFIIFFSYKQCSISYKLSKKITERSMKMALLIVSWFAFMFFNLQSSASKDYSQVFLWYSTNHLFALIIGIIIFTIFLIMLPKFWKEYDKKSLVIMFVFVFLSVLTRSIFPIFQNVYLGLINRIFVVIPALAGFFIIVKFVIKQIKNK